MKQWEIYLVKFPFTDLTSTKLRPALIISNASFNAHNNYMFVGIFWNKWLSQYSIWLTNMELQEWKLNKKSHIRFQNIFSLHKGLIVKKVWSVKQNYLKNISQKIQDFVDIEK